MNPPFASLLYGREPTHLYLVCHCLLVETEAGLVLVDAGLGRADLADPQRRLGSFIAGLLRPRLEMSDTAADQVEALGYGLRDVRHIVVTHMDLDHIGGLSDFPDAKVHVFRKELDRARGQRTMEDRRRYRPIQWAHGPDWVPCDARGEDWFGFRAVRALEGLPPEILLVPLHGHTHGHVGVAIDAGERWLLHCGDAYFHRDEIERDPPACTPGLAFFQRAAAVDHKLRLHNRARLNALARSEASVRLFSAHDPIEYVRLADV